MTIKRRFSYQTVTADERRVPDFIAAVATLCAPHPRVGLRRDLAVRPRSSEGQESIRPVVHLCRAKGRFGIMKSDSWNELTSRFGST